MTLILASVSAREPPSCSSIAWTISHPHVSLPGIIPTTARAFLYCLYHTTVLLHNLNNVIQASLVIIMLRGRLRSQELQGVSVKKAISR